MKTFHDCLPCFTKQALSALRRSGASDEQIDRAMREVFRHLADIELSLSPPVTATKIHRIVRRLTGAVDPYAEEKTRYNALACSLLPRMSALAESAPDPFLAKVKLAIAGNIIDFGKNSDLHENEVRECFERALHTPVDQPAVERLHQAVRGADSILYLCDNAGEIVFDRLLMEAISYAKLTCAVRGRPIINDATWEDAVQAGIAERTRVISNGGDAPGTVLEECSPAFRDAFDAAGLVIAKGQGNFETLSDVAGKRIFFLLQVKCPVIARDIGHPPGSFVVKDIGVDEPKTVSCNPVPGCKACA